MKIPESIDLPQWQIDAVKKVAKLIPWVFQGRDQVRRNELCYKLAGKLYWPASYVHDRLLTLVHLKILVVSHGWFTIAGS